MRIYKAGAASPLSEDKAGELACINTFSKTELDEDEVYIFSVLLCDNEVDRDYERFSEQTLTELAELFVGATGITDHEWSAKEQRARIYRAEALTLQDTRNSLGMPYMFVKGYAYMLRTESSLELIAEIEGGIKKETSVGCRVAGSICSICGEEFGSPGCPHIKGREYDGELCYAELVGAVDAYEWSFVAVPAQRNAGVMKRYGAGGVTLSKAEHEELLKLSAVGRQHLDELRGEVLRLSLLSDRELYAALRKSSAYMTREELAAMKASLSSRIEEKFPPLTQLPGLSDITVFDGDEYKI